VRIERSRRKEDQVALKRGELVDEVRDGEEAEAVSCTGRQRDEVGSAYCDGWSMCRGVEE
jgi:hypothetical protein